MQFIALFATLALASAGLIAEQPAYSSLSYSAPVAYAADPHQQYHHAAPASSSYTKTISYTQPKAYISQPVASYQSYEPEQHHYVSNYHQEPQHHVYAASPVHYEHGSSEQNIVRSTHGTVSHISKSVDTPHSSVRKYDTRVINDGYKTVQYAQPAAYIQPAVVAKTVVAQPLIKTIAQPIVAKTIVSQPIAHVAQPAHYQYAAQPLHYSAPQYAAQQYVASPYAAQQYAPTQYAAHAPVLASKVHYSPAIEVSHASFESPVAHYSW